MSPLIYILRKSLKNLLKGLKKKPPALIGYILGALFIIGFIIISTIMPSSTMKSRSPEQFGVLITIFLFVTAYLNLKQSIDTGSSFFRFADINFVFTSPLKPNKVLLYGFVKHSGTTLIILMFLLFQIPNIKLNYPIDNVGVIILLIGAFFLFLSLSLLGMLVYSISSKSTDIRGIFMKVLNTLSIIFVSGFFIELYLTKDLATAANRYFNSDIITYIPLLGWFKVVFFSTVHGVNSQVYYNIILIAISFVAMGFGIYKVKTDYYEDVLAATEHREELIRAKKEGRGNINLYKGKVKKNIKHKFSGSGAAAIFNKNILEYKKVGFFFFDKVTLIIVLFGVSIKYFMPHPNIIQVLYWTIYMLFLFSAQGRWSQELNKPYIYLIPENPLNKLFFSTLVENIKNLIDGVLLFSTVGFMFKSDLLTIILSIITYTLFGSVFLYGDVISRRIFGGIHSKVLRIFVKLFLIFFIVLPGLIASIVISVVFKDINFVQYYSLGVLVIYNILVSFILLLIGKGIFSRLELD